MCSSEPFAFTRRFLFKSVFENHFICVPRSPSRLRGIFLLNHLLTINTNAPVGPHRVYEAFSFDFLYEILQTKIKSALAEVAVLQK